MSYQYPAETYLNPMARKASIDDLGDAMRQAIESGELIEVEPPLDHYHAKGLYGRRIYVPAGTTVQTKVHKSQHITVALKGHCIVVDDHGNQTEIIAPGVWVTEPGTQRAVHCIDDVEWLTVHACEETELPLIEKALVSDTMAEYQAELKLLEVSS